MKYTTSPRRFHRPITSIAFAVLLLGPGLARAAECPESSPEDAQERRKLAKEWFSTAESAENAGNDAEATRAYACSYKMVAHPYTAFNLARVAERSGDSELALKMYKAYLTLKPDAQEREKVKGKIKVLEDKLAGGGAPESQGEGVATATEGAAIAPPPGEGGTAETTPEATEKKPEEEVSSEDSGTTPPPERKPVVVQAQKPQPEPAPEPEEISRLPEWIVGGVSAAALIGGVAYNLAARTKMSACQTDSSNGLQGTASKECDDARPLAYASYAFFSVAAVGAAADAVLLMVRRGDSSSNHDSSSVGFVLLPGGGGLAARGRF